MQMSISPLRTPQSVLLIKRTNYLIKTMAPVERSTAIRIARVIGTNDEDEGWTFLCSIDDDDNKRDEQ